MSYASVQILGYLGKDPELRYTKDGTSVCSFSVAVSEKYKDKETTTWFKVTFWGKQADIASQYLAKGKQVHVEGTPSLDEWTDKNGGKHGSLEVRGTALHFVGGQNDNQESSGSQQSGRSGTSKKAIDDDGVEW